MKLFKFVKYMEPGWSQFSSDTGEVTVWTGDKKFESGKDYTWDEIFEGVER